MGIGEDDVAVWQPSRSHRSVIKTDAMVEDVHFTRTAMSAVEVGHRVLAANLSDMAGKGAKPVLVTVAFGVSPAIDAEWIRDCYRGMEALAEASGTAIAGGDITRAAAVFISITIIGEVRASNLKLRGGARPGDVVAVTGPLGTSRAGLEIALDRPDLAALPEAALALATYRTPAPRLAEGRFLAASRNVHAMMDLSDGLSMDLPRMAALSKCGAVIERVPVAESARAVAVAAGDDPNDYALNGGEDFELLVAIEARAFDYLAARYKGRFGRPLERIGRFTAEGGVRLEREGAVEELVRGGWDHLR